MNQVSCHPSGFNISISIFSYINIFSFILVKCLQCYDCADEDECKEPQLVTCDSELAGATHFMLSMFFKDVTPPMTTLPSYNCYSEIMEYGKFKENIVHNPPFPILSYTGIQLHCISF